MMKLKVELQCNCCEKWFPEEVILGPLEVTLSRVPDDIRINPLKFIQSDISLYTFFEFSRIAYDKTNLEYYHSKEWYKLLKIKTHHFSELLFCYECYSNAISKLPAKNNKS